MTHKERVLAAIEGRKADRVPFVPQTTYFALKFSGLAEKDLVQDPAAAAACIAACGEHFDFDAVYAGWESSFNVLAEAIGCHIKASRDFIAGEVEPMVKGKEHLSAIRLPEPSKDGRLPFHHELVKNLKSLVGEKKLIFSYVPGPLTMAGLMMGLNQLMKNILLDCGYVHQLVERMVDPIKIFAEMKIKAGTDVIVIADPTASCSVISADMFRVFSAPYLSRLSAFIGEQGAIPSLHICGKTLPVLGMIGDLGFSIFEVDHINSMEEVIKAAGTEICLQGNIDPSRLVMGKSEDIYNLSMAALRQTSGRDRFILSSGCEVGKNTPDDNLEAMAKARNDFTESNKS